MNVNAAKEISPNSGVETINPLVTQLRKSFRTDKTKPLAWRRDQLNALDKIIDKEESRILDALKKDLGKCDYEGWVTEIGFVKSEIASALKNLNKWTKPRKVKTPMVAQPGKSFLLAEPLGTVLIIGAWNYPLQLVLAPMVAAIAAGNCVVIKPSELAPTVSALIKELLHESLDNDAIAVVEGAVEETTELLKQRFDHIMYTGGEGVAKIVMRAASEHLTPVTLELGGKSPCIVDSNVKLNVAAARIVWSKWMNAGQTCVAPDYVIVEKKYCEELVAALKRNLEKCYGTDPSTSDDFGRIVNERHCKRLISYLEGQNAVVGGDHDVEQRYLSPTIVVDPAKGSALLEEEIFGPILPIITVDKIEDSIEIVRSRSKPLAMYLFTRDHKLEQKMLTSISAGNVAINDGMMFMANPQLPFGGVGNSGMGRYHGQFGFDTFSHLKAVIKRGTLLDPNLRYPPYTDSKLSIMKKMV